MPKRKHPVFTVFDTDSATGNNTCRNCSAIIVGSHASNLMNHLKKKHLPIFNEIDGIRLGRENLELPSSQTSIESFTESRKILPITLNISFESLVSILIEQICINGRPIRSIEDSEMAKILRPSMNQLCFLKTNLIR